MTRSVLLGNTIMNEDSVSDLRNLPVASANLFFDGKIWELIETSVRCRGESADPNSATSVHRLRAIGKFTNLEANLRCEVQST